MNDPTPVGVGIIVGPTREDMLAKKTDGPILIHRVFPGSPAAKAGLLRGDRVVAVDGTAPKDLNDVLGLIKAAAEGRPVKITVERKGTTMDFSMTKEAFDRGNLTGKVTADGVGVLRLHAFEKGTTEALDALLPQLEAKHGGPLRGVVLDLRDNPGGMTLEAIGVLQRFVGTRSVLAQFLYPNMGREVYISNPAAARFASVPLIVLVNGRSASASELVAGSLKGRRALVLGTRTFGKGVQQAVIPLPDDSALSFTNAQYFTPHTSPEEVGVEPDVVLQDADEPVPDEGDPDPALHTAVRAFTQADAAAKTLAPAPAQAPAPAAPSP
jgi:carboxyl-terminal processing protease